MKKYLILLAAGAVALTGMTLSASEQVDAPPTEVWGQPVLSGLEMTPTAPIAAEPMTIFSSIDPDNLGNEAYAIVAMSADSDLAPGGQAPTTKEFFVLTDFSVEFTPPLDKSYIFSYVDYSSGLSELSTYTPAGEFLPSTATLSAALYAPTTAPEGATGATMVSTTLQVNPSGTSASLAALLGTKSLSEPAGSAGKPLATTALPA